MIAVCFCALPLICGNVQKEGIKGIAKPYTGTYKAEKVLYGEENVMPLLKDLKIELCADGKLKIVYKLGVKTQTKQLRYKVDEQGKIFVGEEHSNETEWKEVVYDKGKLIATFPLGKKTLHAVFER